MKDHIAIPTPTSCIDTRSAASTHALLLEWLLYPQCAHFTKTHREAINWHDLLAYYLEVDNEVRFQVLVDYLCQQNYQQLCNHKLIPLILRHLLPIILTVIQTPYQALTSFLDVTDTLLKDEAQHNNQRLQVLLQLLTQQSKLMSSYFYNSPKALVNMLKKMKRWQKIASTESMMMRIMPILFDMAMVIYLQLPRKQTYRFATLEVRTLLLGWFKYVHIMVNHSHESDLTTTMFISYFKSQEKRQQLLTLIKTQYMQASASLEDYVIPLNGIPGPQADKPCISRACGGLLRLW